MKQKKETAVNCCSLINNERKLGLAVCRFNEEDEQELLCCDASLQPSCWQAKVDVPAREERLKEPKPKDWKTGWLATDEEEGHRRSRRALAAFTSGSFAGGGGGTRGALTAAAEAAAAEAVVVESSEKVNHTNHTTVDDPRNRGRGAMGRMGIEERERGETGWKKEEKTHDEGDREIKEALPFPSLVMPTAAAAACTTVHIVVSTVLHSSPQFSTMLLQQLSASLSSFPYSLSAWLSTPSLHWSDWSALAIEREEPPTVVTSSSFIDSLSSWRPTAPLTRWFLLSTSFTVLVSSFSFFNNNILFDASSSIIHWTKNIMNSVIHDKWDLI